MKGVGGTLIMSIVGAVLASSIMGVTIQSGLSYGELFQSETVKTTGERIESGVHAADALDEAKLEMRLKGPKKYQIYEEEGQKYLSYDPSDENTREIGNLPDLEYSINRQKDDPSVQYICIVKDSIGSISIRGGECNSG